MQHGEGTFKGTGGFDLYYQCWLPDGELKASMVLVHGLGEHSGRYLNLVQWLVPKGYGVYAYDQRGHGRTPGQRGHVERWEEFREDLRVFRHWVRGEQPRYPLFLMGHSFGGLVVLEHVLHHPEGLRGVVVSAPALSVAGFSPFRVVLSRFLSRIWPRFSLHTGLDVSGLSRDSQVVKAYVEDPLVHFKGTSRMGGEAYLAIQWTRAHAGDLDVPLLVLHGGGDRLVPPDASRTFFEQVSSPDKVRYEYAGYYHEMHNDVERERPLSDLEAWLEVHL